MERILLLGGSGTLGSEVLHLLSTENFDFVAPASRNLDIRDRDQLFKFVSVESWWRYNHNNVREWCKKVLTGTTHACDNIIAFNEKPLSNSLDIQKRNLEPTLYDQT